MYDQTRILLNTINRRHCNLQLTLLFQYFMNGDLNNLHSCIGFGDWNPRKTNKCGIPLKYGPRDFVQGFIREFGSTLWAKLSFSLSPRCHWKMCVFFRICVDVWESKFALVSIQKRRKLKKSKVKSWTTFQVTYSKLFSNFVWPLIQLHYILMDFPALKDWRLFYQNSSLYVIAFENYDFTEKVENRSR